MAYSISSLLKRKKKTNLIKNSLIYVGADAFARVVSFLLLPIVSRYLIPEQLGIAANFDVLQNILSLLGGMATVNGLAYYFYKSSKKEIASLVSSLIFLIVGSNVIFAVVIFFLHANIEGYLHLGIGLQLLAVSSTVALLVSDIDKLLFRLEDKPYKFAILQFGQSVFYILLQLFLVVHLEMQAVGRIYSLVASLLLFSIVHVIILIRKGYLRFIYDPVAIKELLHFGVPLLPHAMSFWIKSGMDKILLTTYCGLAVNGLYSMAMTFGAIYTMCEMSFFKSYSPYLQKRISLFTPENETKEKYRIVKQAYTIAGGFGILYFVLLAFCWVAIYHVVDSRYIPCFEFIPWILLSCTIHIFYSLTIEYIYTAKKTGGLSVITFSGSLFQLLMTYLLVKNFGADGIKYSIILGGVVIMLGIWVYSNRVYPMPWFKVFRNGRRV